MDCHGFIRNCKSIEPQWVSSNCSLILRCEETEEFFKKCGVMGEKQVHDMENILFSENPSPAIPHLPNPCSLIY
jgi:hypothetical protein